MTQYYNLEVRTDLNVLTEALDWFSQFQRFFSSQSSWLECQTVLMEGLTNAIRHAHRGYSSDTPIQIEVTILQEYLEIRIWDYGSDFDLERKLQENLEIAAPYQVGGRGLKLIQKLSDRFQYTRWEDTRNCLLIVKNYSPHLGEEDLLPNL